MNLRILKEDFEHLMGDIDIENGYDPCDSHFTRALNVGLMWKVCKAMHDDSDVVMTRSLEDSELDFIESELEGAERYLEMYATTKDSSYKDMAYDELKHSNILIRKKKSSGVRSDEQNGISRAELKHREILKKLDSL